MDAFEEAIFWHTDGADRIDWHRELLDIRLLPEVRPGDVFPGWRTAGCKPEETC